MSDMNDTTRRRTELLHELTLEGYFGEKARLYAEGVADTTQGIPFALEMIRDLYSSTTTDEESIHGIVDLVIQLLIITYRDAKRADPLVAMAFYTSLIQDYPNAPESCIYPTFETLVKSAYAHQDAISSKSPVAIEQTALKLVEAYNEFLNSLFGPMLACLRAARGKQISRNLFKKRYAERVAELGELTGGENGAYYIFGRIAKPLIRNSVAHGTVWFDRPKEVFRFPDNKGVLQEVGLVELMGLALVGSRLAHAYVIAICVIQVMEEGSAADIAQLPKHLVHAFRHVPA